MEQLHYTKESIFPFSLYITGLNTCHSTLAQADDAVTEHNKVAKMLKGITTVNPSLAAAMQNIISNPGTKNNFTAASSELSEQITLIFPRRSPSPWCRMWSASSWSRNRQPSRRRWPGTWPWSWSRRPWLWPRKWKRNGRGRGRGGQGRGGRGRGGATLADGVDISDVTQSLLLRSRVGNPHK
jgi:hypothetical protein